MDNEQRSAGFRANTRISVVLKGAQIIEQVPAGFKRRGGHFRSPGVDREQGREDLFGVSGSCILPCSVKALKKGTEASQFLFRFNGGAIGTSAFGANVDDIGTLPNKLTRLLQRPFMVDPPVAAERIVIDIDDTHDQRAARKSNASITGKQFHLVLEGILFQG